MTNDPDLTDIDEVMSRLGDPEYLTSTSMELRKDIDKVIAYQRKQRSQREAGVRTKKPKTEAAPAVSIEQLLGSLPKAPTQPSTIKRRF